MLRNNPLLPLLGEALEGSSTTDAPIVTKEVLLGCIRRHNKCLGALRQGCDLLGHNFKVATDQQNSLLAKVEALDYRVGVQESKLDEFGEHLTKSDLQVGQLWKRMNKLAALEAQQQKQAVEIRAIQTWCQQLSKDREQEALGFQQQFDTIEGTLSEQDQSILTIQGKLSRLSRELYISSDQVTVTPLDDDVDRPLNGAAVATASLTSELERMDAMSQEMARNLELSRRVTATHTKELDLKASKDTEILATENKQHLAEIQKFLNSNMDVDLMDIRRSQDLILSQLEDYQKDLDEKTTEEQVDSRIQHRYDELVTHLQIALRSVRDDEANFRACVQRIEETNSELKIAKAERSELKELRAQIGVQLTEVAKAAHELAPDARALLNSAIRREEMLIMLQGKAESSFVKALSCETASLAKSTQEVNDRISALFARQTQTLSDLASASEHGDSVLGSRLNDLEAILMSIRGSAKSVPKSQTIALPPTQTQSPPTAFKAASSTPGKSQSDDYDPSKPPVVDAFQARGEDAKRSVEVATQEGEVATGHQSTLAPFLMKQEPEAKPSSGPLVSYLKPASGA